MKKIKSEFKQVETLVTIRTNAEFIQVETRLGYCPAFTIFPDENKKGSYFNREEIGYKANSIGMVEVENPNNQHIKLSIYKENI